MLTETSYQQGGRLLMALALAGLALAGGMTFVLVFPVKPTAPPGVPVTMPRGVSLDTNLNFSPSFVRVVRGNTVTWTNRDDAPHTATATSWPSGAVKFDSGELNSGDAFGWSLTVVGNYTYHCTFHPGWMTGTIIVATS